MKNKAKCLNDLDVYNTKECLELHDKLPHSQQEREKIKELKERNYREIRDIVTEEEKIPVWICIGWQTNQVEWVDENGKMYNSIFIFKEGALIEKNWLTSLKGE